VPDEPTRNVALNREPSLGNLSLWRDLHAKHWLLYVRGFAVHFYRERGGRVFYFLRYPSWDHPNLSGYPEFRRCWRAL
jgi:hypothetical protein